jgi:hypothetical protein
VDEIMSHMQVASKKAPIMGFGPLPVRMGVVGSRSGSRKTSRGPRINKEGCLTECFSCRLESELAKHPAACERTDGI